MLFKLAYPEDLPLCNECIASTGSYYPVDLRDIGGMAIVAWDGEKIAGVIWATVSGKLAYQDYLAVAPEYQHRGLGIRLSLRLRNALLALGVTQVRYTIHASNTEALKISQAYGALLDGPYVSGCMLIGERHGQH